MVNSLSASSVSKMGGIMCQPFMGILAYLLGKKKKMLCYDFVETLYLRRNVWMSSFAQKKNFVSTMHRYLDIGQRRHLALTKNYTLDLDYEKNAFL